MEIGIFYHLQFEKDLSVLNFPQSSVIYDFFMKDIIQNTVLQGSLKNFD